MMDEAEILESGFEKVGKNLYNKKGNLFVQDKGEMKMASFLNDEVLKKITDFEKYKKLSGKEEKPEEETPEKPEKKEIEAAIPVDKLKEIEFEEGKTGLWSKELNGGLTAFWDYRKTKRGLFYVSTSDDKNPFLPDAEAKELKEYTDIRQDIKLEKKPVKKTLKGELSVVKPSSEEKAIALRGTESDIISLMNNIRLDSIIEASTDKLGEGVLYHDLGSKIGLEPSAELIDMVIADMGNIDVEIVDVDVHRLTDEDTGDSYLTYYATVKAIDKTTGTSGLGAAEQAIDFDELKKNGRSFARTLAIRKACRNSCERLIPVPRKALVVLIKKMLQEHKDNSKK